MNLLLVTVGTLKESYLRDAAAEYDKRLSAYARVERVEIREERIPDEDDPARIAAALRSEGAHILAALPAGYTRVALCVEGKEPDSPALADLIGQVRDTTGKIAFIIGSSWGLDPTVKAACDYRLSLSRLTFPHQLMRVILGEALYRSFTILAGKRYHK